MPPRVRIGSIVHTKEELGNEALFPGSEVDFYVTVPANLNGEIIEIEHDTLWRIKFEDGNIWMLDMNLLNRGRYVPKKKR